MASVQHVAREASPAAAREPINPKETWRKAMARLQASLRRIKPAMDALAEAEHAEFAARGALEALAPPESLTVRTDVEFYFNDGLGTPTCRRYGQDVKLQDEQAIARFVKGDAVAGALYLAELAAWRQQRRDLEVAHAAAKAAAEVKYDASSATIDRSDAQLVRVLRTPAPGMRELRWKIETLHKADCNERCEELGWAYVIRELALLTDGASGASAAVN